MQWTVSHQLSAFSSDFDYIAAATHALAAAAAALYAYSYGAPHTDSSTAVTAPAYIQQLALSYYGYSD
eukprot:scaffold60387_cov13-Prasinocladus_malaysianus.AAC.1